MGTETGKTLLPPTQELPPSAPFCYQTAVVGTQCRHLQAGLWPGSTRAAETLPAPCRRLWPSAEKHLYWLQHCCPAGIVPPAPRKAPHPAAPAPGASPGCPAQGVLRGWWGSSSKRNQQKSVPRWEITRYHQCSWPRIAPSSAHRHHHTALGTSCPSWQAVKAAVPVQTRSSLGSCRQDLVPALQQDQAFQSPRRGRWGAAPPQPGTTRASSACTSSSCSDSCSSSAGS